MATVFTFFTSQHFIVYKTQFQAALVVIEQGRSSQERWQCTTQMVDEKGGCHTHRCVQQAKQFDFCPTKVNFGNKAKSGLC